MTEIADRLLTATTRIVTAWLDANAIAPNALPGLIRDVHRSLTGLEPDRAGGEPEDVRLARPRPMPRPAVDIRKSVFAGHLVCLEDGKTFKTLTRHLGETHRMTPAQYRAKWDLPESYPMIAPDYAKLRSKLSSQIRREKRR
jgi:predicted transcriptional regulator